MSVRVAELLMAVILAACSIALMVKSAELNIGWIEDKGPGSGAWPFWLAVGMLLCCLWTIVRWFKRITPESRSTEPYMSAATVAVVGTSAGALLLLLLLTQYAGIYIALPVFLFIYLKFLGRHSWALTLSLVICIPVFIFVLFEWALKIPLPKAITEEAMYPVYDMVYAQSAAERLGSLKAPIVSLPIFGVICVIVYWAYRFFKRKTVQPGTVDSEGLS